jgi:hypothetical protein
MVGRGSRTTENFLATDLRPSRAQSVQRLLARRAVSIVPPSPSAMNNYNLATLTVRLGWASYLVALQPRLGSDSLHPVRGRKSLDSFATCLRPFRSLALPCWAARP